MLPQLNTQQLRVGGLGFFIPLLTVFWGTDWIKSLPLYSVSLATGSKLGLLLTD